MDEPPPPPVDGDGAAPPPPLQNGSAATAKFDAAYETMLMSEDRDKLQSAMLDELYSEESLIRARTFKPDAHDVILVGAPRSGNGKVSAVLCCLALQTADFSDRLLDAPSVESRDMDTLDIPRAPGQAFRVFSSTSTFASLQPLLERPDGPKFVVLLRNPYDLRLATYRYFAEVLDGRYNSPEQSKFSKCISPDDVCQIALPLIDVFSPIGQIEPDWYERAFVAPWVQMRYKPNRVAFVFYEELIKDPLTVVQRLAEFTQVPLSPALSTAVVGELERNMGRLKEHYRRFHVVTPEGGVGEGAVSLSMTATQIVRESWAAVRAVDRLFENYEAMYANFAANEFPYPMEATLRNKLATKVNSPMEGCMCCHVS